MGTMSNGGIGGGVSSAIARAVGGAGTGADDAGALLAHAVMIALGYGAVFTGVMLLAGGPIYTALGGSGAALEQALSYSNWVFGLAVPVWLVNLIGSALRGAGEVRLPARISLLGAGVMIPVVPALIFGIGPVPPLGIAGAGLAIAGYYGGALIVLLRYLLSGRGVLTLTRHPVARRHLAAIMGVGLVSALGTAVITMIGVATGAGDHARARRVAWTAAAMAFIVAELAGLLLYAAPTLWTAAFSRDAAVLAAGNAYFAVVAPFYGLLGMGLILFFACQGRGKMAWPFAAGLARLAVTAAGVWLLARGGAPLPVVFAAVAAGMALFGAINAYGFWRST